MTALLEYLDFKSGKYSFSTVKPIVINQLNHYKRPCSVLLIVISANITVKGHGFHALFL